MSQCWSVDQCTSEHVELPSSTVTMLHAITAPRNLVPGSAAAVTSVNVVSHVVTHYLLLNVTNNTTVQVQTKPDGRSAHYRSNKRTCLPVKLVFNISTGTTDLYQHPRFQVQYINLRSVPNSCNVWMFQKFGGHSVTFVSATLQRPAQSTVCEGLTTVLVTTFDTLI